MSAAMPMMVGAKGPSLRNSPAVPLKKAMSLRLVMVGLALFAPLSFLVGNHFSANFDGSFLC